MRANIWGNMSNSPIKIQITIQGGGAKFVTMLPAARAFADQRKHGHIHITRLSGASAGSIVAALIAVNANFPSLNNFLKTKARQYVKRMKGPLRWLPRCLQKPLFVFKVWWGWSVVHPELLKEFLLEMFSSSCVDLMDINPNIREITIGEVKRHFKCDLKIALCSLEKLHGHEALDDHLLIDALVDSCSIPLFFRNVKNLAPGQFVDGGLCENLPTSNLFNDMDTYGDLFAITTIDKSTSNIRSAFDLMMAVFGASVNHNVKRSMDLVGGTLNVPVPRKLVHLISMEPWHFAKIKT